MCTSIYLENPKEPISKLVKTGDGVEMPSQCHISEHSKVTEYKANIPQSVLFSLLATNN